MPMIMCPNQKHFFNPDIHSECPSCQQSSEPVSSSPLDRRPQADRPAPTDLISSESSEKTHPAIAAKEQNMNDPTHKTQIIQGRNTPESEHKVTPATRPVTPAQGPKTTILTGDKKIEQKGAQAMTEQLPVVGWLVVTKGPGLGRDFRLIQGENRIGRNKDMEICLDFGDDSISRETHATLVFDHHSNEFFIERGKSRNLAQLNDKTIRGEPNIVAGDRVQLGETELLFVPFCGEHHQW